MNSVWYEMGIRDGYMRGVNPGSFFSSVYSFFLSLYNPARATIWPELKPDEIESKFRFNARKKFSPFPYYVYQNTGIEKYAWVGVSQVKEEIWESAKPDISQISDSESEILGEEIIELKQEQKTGFASAHLQWAKQRYRLIQKMRYCTIPAKIELLQFSYYYFPDWEDWTYNNGYIDYDRINFRDVDRFRITVPEYWNQSGVKWKICVNAAKEKSPDQVTILPNISGNYWITQSPYTSPARPDKENPWTGTFAPLRVRCVVDLSTHPDFSKYFDPKENEEGGNVDAPDYK
jgi:hypothetical protein